MTTTPGTASSNLPGKPPVVDLATWQAARDELLVREKAHTREGDAIAAARRRLPMVEVDGTVEVTGADGPVPFLDLFQGRDELVVYHSMWYDGAPPPGPVRGLHVQRLAHAGRRLPQRPGRLVRRPDLGRVGRGGRLRRVHGLHPALVLGARRGGAARRGRGPHHLFPARRRPRVPHLLHDGPRATSRPTATLGLLDMTPYGRREAWEDNPEGWPEAPRGRCAGRWARRADLLVLARRRRRRRAPGARPAGPCRSGPAPARPPWRPSAGRATTTDAGPESARAGDAAGSGRRITVGGPGRRRR